MKQQPQHKEEPQRASLVDESLVRQSINSLNSSSFMIGDSLTSALPTNLFGPSEPSSNLPAATEVEAPSTTRKKPNQSGFTHDISPIAFKNEEASATKYTNILESARTDHSVAISANDINVQILAQEAGKRLIFEDDENFENASVPTQLFTTDQTTEYSGRSVTTKGAASAAQSDRSLPQDVQIGDGDD